MALILKKIDETEKQKKSRLKKRLDEDCKRNGLMTDDEIQSLTDVDRIKLLKNTIEKISKYYKNNDISRLFTSAKYGLKVYPLDYNSRTKNYHIKNEIKNYDKFIENKMVNTFMFVVSSKENYYPLMYNYAVDLFRFRLQYLENKPIIDKLIDAKKLDDSNQLTEHFSSDLNEKIDFHTNIKEGQLYQYFNYYYSDNTTTPKEEKLYNIIKARYDLFHLLFRKKIENITIDTTLSNPYEFI